MRQLSPHSERLFERYGMQQFGPDVRLKTSTNSQPTWIRRFLRSRRNTIKRFCRRRSIPDRREAPGADPGVCLDEDSSKELAKVRNQQNYINRYINKRFSPAVAKTYKEEVQRRVAAACKRSVLPTPEYKIFGHAARHKVAVQAMAKANLVKVIPRRRSRCC